MNMKKLRIAVDIDDTLYHNAVVPEFLDEFGIPRFVQDSWDFNFPEMTPENKEKLITRFVDPKYMCSLNPNPGSDAVKRWKAEGHSLTCVTMRRPKITAETVDMVNKDFPGVFDGVVMCNPDRETYGSRDKNAELIAGKYDVYIDDSGEYILAAYKAGVVRNCFLMSNENTPHNKAAVREILSERSRGGMSGVRVVSSWDQIDLPIILQGAFIMCDVMNTNPPRRYPLPLVELRDYESMKFKAEEKDS